MRISIVTYLLLLFFALGTSNNLYVEPSDKEEVIYEKWMQNPDSTDRKIQEEVDAKKRKKQKYIVPAADTKTDVEYTPLNEEKWEKYKNKRDYLENPKEEKEASNFEMPNFNFEGLGFLGQIFKILVYLAIVLGFAFLIFRLIEAQYRTDLQLKNEKHFFIEKLEEQIHSVDLYKLLEEYSAKKEYAMMIRIQYLIIIKELSNRKFIDWQIQKTNGNYLQELFGKSLFENFKNVTQLYERVWFGEVKVDEKLYAQIAPQFVNSLEKIKSL